MSSRAHSYYQDLLEKHISGETLPPEDRLHLFDHIETCDACRVMLEAEEKLMARMKVVPRLVAPSDLRSKILSQAIRDHRERTTTPSEDPELADVLAPSVSVEEPVRLPPVSPAADADDIPVFAGVVQPRPRRLKQIWRRASPALAMGFLAFAGVGALYTGQFQGIPLAGEAQQVVWKVVDSALGRQELPTVGPSENSVVALAENVIDLRDYPDTESTIKKPEVNEQQISRPFAGTEAVASRIGEIRSWIAMADATLATLAKAAQTTTDIPGPAENAAPQIAALVLKPTDSRGNRGGFQRSELAAALEELTRSQPGARLASQDQFATNGHRYRLYTLELPEGCTHRLVQTLNAYQAPEDGQIVNVLASQDHISVGRNQKIQFYSSAGTELRAALESVPSVTASRQEKVRVVVVE